MIYKKILRFLLLLIVCIIATVWDVFFYTIDKVHLICKAVNTWGEVNLEKFYDWYNGPH